MWPEFTEPGRVTVESLPVAVAFSIAPVLVHGPPKSLGLVFSPLKISVLSYCLNCCSVVGSVK